MFQGVIMRDYETGMVTIGSAERLPRDKTIDVFRRCVCYANAAIYTLTRYVRGRTNRNKQLMLTVKELTSKRCVVLACFEFEVEDNVEATLSRAKEIAITCLGEGGQLVFEIQGGRAYKYIPDIDKYEEVTVCIQ